jgi:hypothetical protein
MNDDIVARARQNDAFRREVITGQHSQVVLMSIYTVYAPPEHSPGTVHQTKAEADAAEAAEGH